MRVWIAQCLCPNRHAIAAIAEAMEDETAAMMLTWSLREQVAELLRSGLNPWCGICKAPSEEWRYEVGRTRFTSMAEAAPHLRRTEADQVVTGAVFGEVLGEEKIVPKKEPEVR